MKKLLLAILLTLTTPLMAQQETTLSVSGTGTVSVEPDIGYFSIQIESVKPTPAAALDKLKTVTDAIFKTLATEGIKKNEVSTLSLVLNKHYINADTGKKDKYGNPITKRVQNGYVAQTNLKVLVSDIKKLGKSLTKVVEIDRTYNQESIGGGLENLPTRTTILISNIGFACSNAEESQEKARVLAVKNAEEKAKVIAENLENVELDGVLRVNESSYNRPYSDTRSLNYEVANKGVPISGGMFKHSVNVSVVWKIKNKK